MELVPSAGQRALAVLSEHLQALGAGDGDRLPPERELAATLGLSRRALRTALGRLQAEGVVWRGVGQGTFLGRAPRHRGPGAAPSASGPLEVMQARLLFEPPLAGLAAVAWVPQELRAIEAGGRHCGEATSAAEWGLRDTRFHHAIAQASHNPLLLAMFEQLEHARGMTDWGRLRGIVATPAVRARASAEHRALCRAIASRDPERAHAAMLAHLTSIRTAIEDALFRPPATPAGS